MSNAKKCQIIMSNSFTYDFYISYTIIWYTFEQFQSMYQELQNVNNLTILEI